MVCCSHDINATAASMSMSLQDSCHFYSQDLQLDKTEDYFSLLVVCIAPYSTMKASSGDDALGQ